MLGLRACDEALAAIEASKGNLGKGGAKKQYGQAGEELTKQARELVSVISRMATVAKNDPEKVGDASKAVADAIPKYDTIFNFFSVHNFFLLNLDWLRQSIQLRPLLRKKM